MSAADNLNNLLNESSETEEVLGSQVFSDAHIAEQLANEVFAGQFRYANKLGWLKWDGMRWRESAQVDASELARLWAVGKFENATDTWKKATANGSRHDADRAGEDVAGWRRFLASTRLDAIVRYARGVHGVLTDHADFDAHPDLLNTQSGVVDFTTGELRPHDPNLLMTKVTSAAYVPGAGHADWKQALEAVPADIHDWWQIRLGQAITGHIPPDDIMLVQQGSGENGKTTLMSAIGRALGDYYLAVPHRALLAASNAHTTEMTGFWGARLAVLEELPEEHYLNTNRLKQIVGTPTMTARKIAQNDMTWDVSHSLIVNTNYRPGVSETDHGTWRRLALVIFPYRFVSKDDELLDENDRRGDEGLRQRLRLGNDGQGEAVLAWLVDGAVKWYADGQVLPPLPPRVKEDTQEWRGDSDVLYQYLTEELVPDPDSYILAEDLYEDFRTWLEAKNHKSWTDKLIAERITQHEVAREMRMGKQRARHRRGRSRPYRWTDAELGGEAREAAGPVTMWTGVRFASDRMEVSDQPKPRSVQDVQTPVRVPKKIPSRKTSDTTLHTLHGRPRRTVTGTRSKRSTGGS